MTIILIYTVGIVACALLLYYYLRYLWRHSESPLLSYNPTTYCIENTPFSKDIIRQLINFLPNASCQKRIGKNTNPTHPTHPTHHYLWELVKTEPRTFPLFILENDVQISPDIQSQLTRHIKIPNYMEDAWDVIILCNDYVTQHAPPSRLVRTEPSAFNPERAPKAYLLSESGAHKLLRGLQLDAVYYVHPPLVKVQYQ